MTTFVTNGNRIEMLPRVFYDDYNRPTRNCIVDAEERPVLGELILLRDFDGDFQSECVVLRVTAIPTRNTGRTNRALPLDRSRKQLFLELEKVGDIEYL